MYSVHVQIYKQINMHTYTIPDTYQSIATIGECGSGVGQFRSPAGICVDSQVCVCVCTRARARARRERERDRVNPRNYECVS